MNLISQIIALLLSMLPKEAFKKAVDKLLDSIENAVEESEGKLDDAIILPLCDKARELLDVPDND